jgi:hypothetical protein
MQLDKGQRRIVRRSAQAEPDVATGGIPLNEQVPVASHDDVAGLEDRVDRWPASIGYRNRTQLFAKEPDDDESKVCEEGVVSKASCESRRAIFAYRDIFVSAQDREEVHYVRDERRGLFGVEVLVGLSEPASD